MLRRHRLQLRCRIPTVGRNLTRLNRVWCSGNIVDSHFSGVTALSTAPGSTPGIRVSYLFPSGATPFPFASQSRTTDRPREKGIRKCAEQAAIHPPTHRFPAARASQTRPHEPGLLQYPRGGSTKDALPQSADAFAPSAAPSAAASTPGSGEGAISPFVEALKRPRIRSVRPRQGTSGTWRSATRSSACMRLYRTRTVSAAATAGRWLWMDKGLGAAAPAAQGATGGYWILRFSAQRKSSKKKASEESFGSSLCWVSLGGDRSGRCMLGE